MRLPLLVILTAFLLAACGQSEPPAKGEAGPPGPTGPPGPAGPPGSAVNGPAVRVITAPCEQTACGASCKENELILNAYALNPGGEIVFVDERNLTFRPKERPTVLVLACIAVAQELSVEDRARGTRTGGRAAPANLAAVPLKIGRASPLPLASCRILPRLRSSEAVRCRAHRSKDGATRTCPTSRWKSTSTWPDRVQLTSLTASDKAS